jgi:hypothetical protein
MQYMANGLFARAKQPLIVLLIEGRKFNRDLLQGCDRVAVDQERHRGWTSFWPH